MMEGCSKHLDLSSENKERRQSERKIISATVNIAYLDNQYAGKVKNISKGGALITCRDYFNIGSYLQLEISCKGKFLACYGKVIHFKQNIDGEFDTGIKFVKAPKEKIKSKEEKQFAQRAKEHTIEVDRATSGVFLRDLLIKNFYSLFGLTPDATREEIRKRYLKLSKTYQDTNEQDKLAELNHAYVILKDPQKRKNYDSLLKTTKRDLT